jgi:protein transport protein SEC61 subunit beta
MQPMYYSEDSLGLKIGPTTVLVLSLLFIACVVVLHIGGKLTAQR